MPDTEVVCNPRRLFFCCILRQFHSDIKVWLVQSQDPDDRFILQIDIVMRFIYNVSNIMTIRRAMSLRHGHNIRMSTVLASGRPQILCKLSYLAKLKNCSNCPSIETARTDIIFPCGWFQNVIIMKWEGGGRELDEKEWW